MILFTILAIIAIVIGLVAIITVGVSAVTMIIAFGDVIVCVAVLVFIIKHLFRKFRR